MRETTVDVDQQSSLLILARNDSKFCISTVSKNKADLIGFSSEACGQCYKTSYDRNLRIFVISYCVCPRQAFPA